MGSNPSRDAIILETSMSLAIYPGYVAAFAAIAFALGICLGMIFADVCKVAADRTAVKWITGLLAFLGTCIATGVLLYYRAGGQ